MQKLHVLLIALALLFGCARDKSPVTPTDGARLGFFFLADENISLYNIGDYSVETLDLAETPWLSDTNILTYNFSKHIIVLNKPLKQMFPQFASSGQLMQAFNVKPFVVVADGEACYLAAFHAAYSSLSRETPYIDLLTADFNSLHSFAIFQEWNIDDVKIDHRDDARVKRVLQELGKYSSD
jgi:hypothetical protein